jgi:DhnA family fructose-bisphosphate aldolase class Ia
MDMVRRRPSAVPFISDYLIEDDVMNHKQNRLKEMFSPGDGRSLVVDTSNGLSLGALPGLEHFKPAVNGVLPLVDGIVTSPGQSRNLGHRTRQEAALLIRADWTNAIRDEDFVLPPAKIEYLPLLGPQEALDLGANALVMHFILGCEEDIEAQCMKRVVDLALNGLAPGMPLIVDVQPIGPRVVLMKKAIELGVSYALEGGADGIVIPWPGRQSFETIQAMCHGLSVWVKPPDLDPGSPESLGALTRGAVGFWLDERVFADNDPISLLQSWHSLVHAPVEV